MKKRDDQRQRVYDWEFTHVHPKISDNISFDTAVHVGMHIWGELGLKYPPIFKPLSKKARCGGKANRMNVFLPDQTTTGIVIHELAHSLTCGIEGDSHMHDEYFVGMYIKLLDRFTGLNLPVLMYTLKLSNVEFNLGGSPVCMEQ